MSIHMSIHSDDKAEYDICIHMSVHESMRSYDKAERNMSMHVSLHMSICISMHMGIHISMHMSMHSYDKAECDIELAKKHAEFFLPHDDNGESYHNEYVTITRLS